MNCVGLTAEDIAMQLLKHVTAPKSPKKSQAAWHKKLSIPYLYHEQCKEAYDSILLLPAPQACRYGLFKIARKSLLLDVMRLG